jgi:hypothetical protein
MFEHFLIVKMITFVIIYSSLECGFLYNNFSVGGSVAKAKEARVSIIKLTFSKINKPIASK